jgi:hypothetical protein
MKQHSNTVIACASLLIISLILAHAITNRNKANNAK